MKYEISAEKKKNKKFNPHLLVSIYQVNQEGAKTKIGEYTRDHKDLFNTFYPFKQDDKDYALISNHYSKTAVVELPSCRMVAEESWSVKDTFYPTDYYVPKNNIVNGQFGFVAGCRLNDETSFKIQFLDLSEITKGKILRDDRFGYIELPDKIKLEDAVDDWFYDKKQKVVDFAIHMRFNVDGKLINRENIATLLKNNGYIVFDKKRVVRGE